MRRLLLLSVLTAFAVCSCGTGAKVVGSKSESGVTEFRLGTYNLWRSDLGKDEYEWSLRKEKLARSIVDIGFDVFGIQEVDTTIQRELPGLVEKAGGEYEWFIFSPYSQDGKGGKAQGIVYRRDRFEMLESHCFWLSPTPEVMSSGWDEMKFRRGACCAVFRDKLTGQRFFLMMSHMPLGREANAKSAPIILEMAGKYNPEGLPSFFVGDLNTREERESSVLFRTYWSDTFFTIPEELRDGPKGTFNNHGRNKVMDEAPRIDFIYFRGEGVTPLRYVCHDRKYGEIYPSDHCPVYADFRIIDK